MDTHVSELLVISHQPSVYREEIPVFIIIDLDIHVSRNTCDFEQVPVDL
jgi:hypothetical protein